VAKISPFGIELVKISVKTVLPSNWLPTFMSGANSCELLLDSIHFSGPLPATRFPHRTTRQDCYKLRYEVSKAMAE
jgi:hypothetical protein